MRDDRDGECDCAVGVSDEPPPAGVLSAADDRVARLGADPLAKMLGCSGGRDRWMPGLEDVLEPFVALSDGF